MQAAGVPIEVARQSVLAQLGLPAQPDATARASVAANPADADRMTVDTIKAVLAAAVVQPWMLREGNVAHELIGAEYG
jgi:hypothetical protein